MVDVNPEDDRWIDEDPFRDIPVTSNLLLTSAFIAGLLLVLIGTSMGYWFTTSGGEIQIIDTSFETESGVDIAATIYKPPTATPENQAPAALLIHGYTAEKGTMSSFATELSRRGYVAVAIDQPGHAASGPPAFKDGFGGPDSLQFTRSLAFTDPDKVAMAGHSMGGFASLTAAEKHPDGYKSIILIGSSPGLGMPTGEWTVPDADPEFPRNLAVVFGEYDEFSLYMWGEPIPGNVAQSNKLKEIFDSESTIEEGRIYGDVDQHTGRLFVSPGNIHAGMHRSPSTVAATLEWISITLDRETTIPASNQRWFYASIGHVLAFIGGLIAVVSGTSLMWRRTGGSRGVRKRTPRKPKSTLAVLSIVPALTIYPLYALGTFGVPLTDFTHQELTHGFILWGIGAVALCGLFIRLRHGGVNSDSVDFLISTKDIRNGTIAALAGFTLLYLFALTTWFIPGGGIRAWIVGFGPLTSLRWFSFLVYLLPFLFIGFSISATCGYVIGCSKSMTRDIVTSLIVFCGGLLLLLLAQYIPLLLGFGLPIPAMGPLTTLTLRGTAVIAILALVSMPCYRLTDSAWPGGILAGLILTLSIVATSPVHIAPF